ncbi:hypothetical protein FQA39_LY06105 [Lamprigera yunnana]|nr:hypothetical protein FQA39_LY06105 [Lamprigera yunnana]
MFKRDNANYYVQKKTKQFAKELFCGTYLYAYIPYSASKNFAVVERGCSTTHGIKTKTRARLDIPTLDPLVRLKLPRVPCDEFDYSKAYKLWTENSIRGRYNVGQECEMLPLQCSVDFLNLAYSFLMTENMGSITTSTSDCASLPATSPRHRSFMENLLVAKMEQTAVGNHLYSDRALVRTNSTDSTSSVGSVTSTTSDVCKCDDCLLGLTDLHAADQEEATKKKKVCCPIIKFFQLISHGVLLH